ncbi:MAG: pilus assembly protein PilX [Pseudomonas sp.]|nr:pilus assembly protein PilX [Pseudomonas sp.]
MNASPHRQRGVSLLIALLMLLVITTLALSSLREASMEAKMTGNRALLNDLQNSADSALREAEFRFYGAGGKQELLEKLEPTARNCRKTNQLKSNGINLPCLLNFAESELASLHKTPLLALKNKDASKGKPLYSQSAANDADLLWMPYRGLSAAEPSQGLYPAYWNTTLIRSLNVEYGQELEGKGTYLYLINATSSLDESTEDSYRATLQSTISNIYIGLNN